jgi:hypothetical protein
MKESTGWFVSWVMVMAWLVQRIDEDRRETERLVAENAAVQARVDAVHNETAEVRARIARIRAETEALQTHPFPPLKPEVTWPPAEPAPQQPTPVPIPPCSYEMLPVHVPMKLDEMR